MSSFSCCLDALQQCEGCSQRRSVAYHGRRGDRSFCATCWLSMDNDDPTPTGRLGSRGTELQHHAWSSRIGLPKDQQSVGSGTFAIKRGTRGLERKRPASVGAVGEATSHCANARKRVPYAEASHPSSTASIPDFLHARKRAPYAEDARPSSTASTPGLLCGSGSGRGALLCETPGVLCGIGPLTGRQRAGERYCAKLRLESPASQCSTSCRSAPSLLSSPASSASGSPASSRPSSSQAPRSCLASAEGRARARSSSRAVHFVI